jgi:hypothetical protein
LKTVSITSNPTPSSNKYLEEDMHCEAATDEETKTLK